MSKQVQLKISGPGKALSKEQKKFNRLVEQIRRLRDSITSYQELDLLLRNLGETQVRPAEEKAQAALRELVMSLHHNPHFIDLDKRQAKKFDLILLNEIRHLLQTPFYFEDAELRQMYEDYLGGEKTFDEILAEQELEARNMASEFMQNMFGIDIEEDDFENPERVMEKLESQKAAFEAAEQARAERMARRQKTPAQLQAEQKRAAAENTLKKSVKQIYHDLVRHFHPDQEQDETRRASKTEIMKQITTAYEANDHLRLLELQLTLLENRDNLFAQFDNTQLRYFNQALQKQVFDLEDELASYHPGNTGNPYSMLFGPHKILIERNVRMHLQGQESMVRSIRQTIQMIGTANGLKRFVLDFELDDEPEGIDMDELFQMMPQSGRKKRRR